MWTSGAKLHHKNKGAGLRHTLAKFRTTEGTNGNDVVRCNLELKVDQPFCSVRLVDLRWIVAVDLADKMRRLNPVVLWSMRVTDQCGLP